MSKRVHLNVENYSPRKRVALAMLAKGYNVRTLAKQLGVSHQCMYNRLKKWNWSFEEVRKLSKTLEIPMNDLTSN